MAKNFSTLSKKTDIQIQKTQCCKKMNPERLTLRNIIFKMAKAKDKEKILKAAREN